MSATPTMFLGEDGKAINRNEILGPKSVAIPGTLKLLYTTHQKHGSLSWESLIEPAIQYAKQGYAMNSYTFDILVRESARLVEDPEIKQLYWQDNQVKPAGTLMTNLSLHEPRGSGRAGRQLYVSGRFSKTYSRNRE